MQFNKLHYGNPNQVQLSHISTKNYLDNLFGELSDYFPPDNDSSVVQQELNDLVVFVKELKSNEQLRSRYEIYDSNLFGFIKNVVSNSGIPHDEVSELVESIRNDISPLLATLKHRFNRVRPSQLAYYYKLALFPFHSVTDATASYPSGHAYQSKIICEVLAIRYPKYYKQLIELYQDISMSRLYMGLHYQSDIDFAFFAADKVLSHPEFKKKYRL